MALAGLLAAVASVEASGGADRLTVGAAASQPAGDSKQPAGRAARQDTQTPAPVPECAVGQFRIVIGAAGARHARATQALDVTNDGDDCSLPPQVRVTVDGTTTLTAPTGQARFTKARPPQ